MAKPLARRILRIALWVTGSIAALAVVAVAAIVIVIHTAWGKEQIRGKLEAALDAKVRGDVRIGEVDGSVLGNLIVRDIEVVDDAGVVVASIERASLDLGLIDFVVSSEVDLEHLHLDGVVVRGHREPDGSLDLARLLILEQEPLPYDVTIHDLAVTRVSLSLDHGGGTVDHLDHVELRGTVAIRDAGDRTTVSTRVHGWWRERAVPIALHGGIELDRGIVSVRGVTGTLGTIAVTAPSLRIDGTRFTGSVSAVATVDAVRMLMPDTKLRGDLAVTLTVSPDETAGTRVAIAGVAGGAPITGNVVVDPETQRLRGHVGALALDVRDLVDVTPPEGTEGPVDVSIDGEVDLRSRRAEVRAIAKDARGAAVTALAAIDFGRDDGIAVRGCVHGEHVAVTDLAARSLTVHVDVAGLPDDPRGTVHVVGAGVRKGQDVIGPIELDAATRDDGKLAVIARAGTKRTRWRLDVAATVGFGDVVTVALGRHHGVAEGVAWSGRGGVITIAPDQVEVRGVRVAVAGGKVAVDATIGRAEHDGRLDADVVARDVDVAAVARLLDQPRGPRGRADVTAHVTKRGTAWSGKAKAIARGVVVRPGGAPVDATVDVSAKPGDVQVAAMVRGDAIGRASFTLDVAAPRKLTDPAAWQRLPRSAIRHGRIHLEELDLAAIAAVIGVEPTATGRVDGELTLTADRTEGTVRATGLVVEGAPGPIDGVIALIPAAPGVIDARLDAEVRGIGTAHVTASVAVPVRPFDVDAWRNLDASAIRGVDARIDDIMLDGEMAIRLGLGTSWQGRASLAIAVAPGLTSATIAADLLGVVGGPLLRRVDLHVDARAERDRIVATVQAGVDGSWLLDAEGEVAISPAALFEGGADALRAAPVTGQVTVDRASVRRLLHVVGRDQEITGTISVDAAVTGTVGAPEATARITLEDVGEQDAKLKLLRIDAAYAAGIARLEARGQQADGGVLRIDAEVEVAKLDDLRLSVQAKGFEIEPLATLGPIATLGMSGRLDADLTLHGIDPATAKVAGTLRLRAGRFPLGASLGTMRHAEITVTLDGKAVDLAVNGHVGAGVIDVRGTARLVGLMPSRADLEIEVRNVTLLAQRRPNINSKITARIVREGEQWRVKAELRGTRVVLADVDGRVLHDVGAPDDVVFIEDGKPSTAAAADKVPRRRFGVRPAEPWLIGDIRLYRTTIRSEELRGQIRGRFTLEVGDDAVSVIGAMDTLQGTVMLFDRRYRVDRAQIRFDGSDDPRIDVRLVHEFPQVTLIVAMRGRMSEPELVLTSDSGDYSQGQLLGFLFGGAPGGRPGDETRDAATMIASSLASAKVGGYVRRFLPVHLDVLRFEAATATDRASVTVGQWLARRLYVGYRRRIDAVPEQNAGQAEVEYWLSPRIVVEGVAGDRGYHDVDLTWVRRW